MAALVVRAAPSNRVCRLLIPLSIQSTFSPRPLGRAALQLVAVGEQPAYADHVIMKESDGVQGDDGDSSVAVVDHACHRPKVVMDGGGGAVLAEAGQPDLA